MISNRSGRHPTITGDTLFWFYWSKGVQSGRRLPFFLYSLAAAYTIQKLAIYRRITVSLLNRVEF